MYSATFIFHSKLLRRFVHVNVDLVGHFLKHCMMYDIHLLLDIWIISRIFLCVCSVCKVNMAEIFGGKDKLFSSFFCVECVK